MVSSFGVIPVSGTFVALTTAPDLEVARKIATAALSAKAAACANIIPQIESHYWWEGKIEQATEVLVIFKTSQERQLALQEVVTANHPYKTPEFIILPIHGGLAAYLGWIRGSLTS
jgi:periplasmic divalent cation tolerance protein